MTHSEFKKRFLPLHQILYCEAFRMLGDKFEAEDAVQNLYLKLWEKREQLTSLASPEGYCRAALRNICIDRWRVLRMQEEKNLEIAEDIISEAPPEIESKETEQCLAHFLSSLSETQQRIMKMNMSGYSFKEIEEITGLSEANIRMIISRLRKRFRKSYII
ncbi:MAG: sigma-70 family RNA polymerase sigma factor [Bacteroidaceae bacterium]|nr:sigma-70 family RNA polymerase sigma factor [Bacteroidaceae bacterium]MBQ5730897.1 sigma-70 family RNA polymerase sigma factor [Bacteroidaceae bacterium]